MKLKLFTALLVCILTPNLLWAARPSINALNTRVNQLEAKVSSQEEEINALKSQVNENTLDIEGITLNTADLEPPQILIEAPATTVGGNELVTTTFSDNQGLFKYRPPRWDNDQDQVSYESEKAIVVEDSVVPRFGEDTLLTAYATDRSGNAATATHIIQSVTGMIPGVYVLDEPLNEPGSGSSCNPANSNPLGADSVSVYGEFVDSYSPYCRNIELENTVACIGIGVNASSYPGAGATDGITSVEDTVFSAETKNGSGSGGGNSYAYFTQMDAEFYDTTPATVSIVMTLRCESTLYGDTTYGPYQMHGTLQQ